MRKIFMLMLLYISIPIFSQTLQRTFQKVSFHNNETTIEVNDGVYQIKFFTPEMVETLFIPKGQVQAEDSHAVQMTPQKVKIKFRDQGQEIKLSTQGITIKISKMPFQIAYYKGNDLIISEKNGYATALQGEINGHSQDFETLSFNLHPDEVLYGGGARALGSHRRGNRLMLYNRAHYGYETKAELLNFSMPIVVSSKKYMIHFDNPSVGYLDLDSQKNNTLTFETTSGRKAYQVITGDSWEHVLNNYTQLTGRQPMLPRWSLGNFSSRFGYHTQQQALETIKRFRAEKIPVDALILDLYWFGKTIQGTLGNFSWDVDNFPQPQQMIHDLRKENVETILITEPFVVTTSNRFQEALKEDILTKNTKGEPYLYDFYFGHTGLIDLYHPKGKQWFKNIYKDILRQGITGIWGDLGEPEVHPSDMVHGNGKNGDQVHNIYGMEWAKLVQESFTDNTPDSRPFILMRAGYSGAQKYGLVPWSGDVSRSWGGLQSQPDIALQMGLQGISYMHSDLGGFAGKNEDDELYVRWLQYGVFNPIYRPHADENVPSEPIYRSEKAKKLAQKAIELRYALLPYNYNLVYENHTKGTPLMRPLFFEEPENKDLFTEHTAYFWGKDFLISPILQPHQKEQKIYFPKNSNWYNFYTDEKIEGGRRISIPTEEDKIPTFVRGGAIIPTAKPMQSTKEYTGNTLELHYYLDEKVRETEIELFNDDGLTPKTIEKEQYEHMEFEAKYNKKTIQFELENNPGKAYPSEIKNIDLVIHQMPKAPKSIRIDGEKYPGQYNPQKNTLSLSMKWNSLVEKKIKIRL